MEGERFFLEYGACWRNFGGEVGRYIVDGCGQFAQDAQGSTNCEACGCDKSFHLTLTLTHINIHNNNNGIDGRAPQPSNSQESVITEVENNVATPLVDHDYDEVSCAEKSTDSNGSKKKKKTNSK